MDEKYLEILQQGLNIELRKAEKGTPLSIYETICAFANVNGGDIFLGVEEKEVKPNILVGIISVDKYEKEILTTLNNPNKFSCSILNDSSFTKIPLKNGRFVLQIHVEEVSRNRKPVYINGSIQNSYKRLKDGDCLLSLEEIKSYLSDNNSESFDSLPNNRGYGFDYVNPETLKAYRNELNRFASQNIYKALDDKSFLKAIAILQNDEKGNEVLTNTGVLMFTSSPLIETIFPFYSLDYIKNVTQIDKWDERIASDDVSWSGNLFDFFLRVISSLSSDIPSAYVGRNGINVGPSLMEEVIKEGLSNAISNHSFFLNGSLVVKRNNLSLIIRNNGKSLTPIEDAYIGGVSRPRNPSIIAFFRRIGTADRAGTGIPKMIDALQANHFPKPILSEESYPMDKTTLSISLIPTNNKKSNDEAKDRIFNLISIADEGISIKELVEKSDYSRSLVSREVNELIIEKRVISNGKVTNGRLFFPLK